MINRLFISFDATSYLISHQDKATKIKGQTLKKVRDSGALQSVKLGEAILVNGTEQN